MTRVTTVEALPRDPATGATSTVKLAGGGFLKPYPAGFRAGLMQHLRFKAALAFDGQKGWSGGTAPAQVSFRHRPSTNADLDALLALYWPDAAVTVQSGEEGGALAAVFTGTIAAAAAQDGALVLTLADLSVTLDKPVCTARFAGTGGVEGGAEAKDRVRRRSWGRCFNIEGRVLDKTTNVYEFGALDFPWSAIDEVRDIGRAYSPVVTVAWAGSIAATLTALKAQAVTDGGCAIAPSIACAKLWTQPKLCTADIRGEVGGGYVETVPEIVERIVQAMSGPSIANVSAMAAVRDGAAGVHIGDDAETAAQAIDRALLGVSLLWVLEPAGTIRLREWTFGSPVETLTAQFVERLQSFAPVKTRRLGYQRNHRVQNEGEIAAVLLYADVADAPTSLAELDPAADTKLDGLPADADNTADALAGGALDLSTPVSGGTTLGDLGGGGGGGTPPVPITAQIGTSGTIALTLEPGASASFEAQIRVTGLSGSCTQAIKIKARAPGGAFTDFTINAADTDTGTVNPMQSGTLTNSTGSAAIFEVAAETSKTGGTGTIDASQSFLRRA